MRRRMSYADAVTLLEPDARLLKALDVAAGGLLLGVKAATAGVAEPVLSLFDVKAELVKVGHRLLSGLADRVRGRTRADRTARLEAAHAVLVVTAFFEAFDELPIPIAPERLALTGADQERLSLFAWSGQVLHSPTQIPGNGAATGIGDLHRTYYAALGERLLAFVQGLSVWDELDETRRAETRRCLGETLTDRAARRYEENYRRLAVEVPEFGFWAGQAEHAATRAEVAELGHSLAGLADLLRRIPSGREPAERRAALARAYRKVLERPSLTDRELPDGLRMPTLGEAYLDPEFRVLARIERPADEDTWSALPVSDRLPEFLAAYLTGPAATEAPLLVLGQPGAGKSVLTSVLAARLPAADFLPVRVPLRDVPAEAGVQDQIESAIYAQTGERVGWPALVRSAGDALPVVLLDGFDELLQATGVAQSDYLERVAAFQEREADQGRPVAVLVTSRTAVADRARCPAGSTAIRLEPFDARHVEAWLAVWQRTNAGHFAAGVRPLTADTALRHPALASQPLLLQMLALYDAEDNALQRADADGIDDAGLYERLLTVFAVRELRKTASAVSDADIRAETERELQRLSLVAFAMFNRGKQWVSAGELDADLGALLPAGNAGDDGRHRPLSQSEVVLGRFFFVQRAAAVRDGERLETYEFLHATFGEYLIARLVHQLLRDLPPARPGLALAGPSTVDDDWLWTLLSFAPLCVRDTILPFLRAPSLRLPPADVPRVRAALVGCFTADDEKPRSRTGYRPGRAQLTSRLAAYRANVLLLLLTVGGDVRASELFDRIPAEEWRRHATRWQAEFTWSEWTTFTETVGVTRTGLDRDRDVLLSLGKAEPTDPDLGWSNRSIPKPIPKSAVSPESTSIGSRRAAFRRLMFAGGRDADLAVHLAWPLLSLPGGGTVAEDGQWESAARTLLDLWVHGRERPVEELTATYVRCASAMMAVAPGEATWKQVLLNCLVYNGITGHQRELSNAIWELWDQWRGSTPFAELADMLRRTVGGDAVPDGGGSGGAEVAGE